MDQSNNKMPWVVFRIEEKLFSISTQHVQAIIKMPVINTLPNYPDYIKGIIRYREKIYKLVNLRNLLGINDLSEKIKAFDELMEARKMDHEAWLTDLENSVRQNIKFTKTTDPKMCAFGKWYYSYKTNDIALRDQLDRFEFPHIRIHKLAIEIGKLQKENNSEKIEALINSAKTTTLQELIRLFDETKIAYAKSLHELAIILEYQNYRTAFPVDKVLTVEYLSPIDLTTVNQKLFENRNTHLILDVSKSSNDELVLKLDADAILKNEFIKSNEYKFEEVV